MSTRDDIADIIATEQTYHMVELRTEGRASRLDHRILDAIEAAGYAIVKLPEEDRNGDYPHVSVNVFDDILIEKRRVTGDEARVTAASLLRAANQLDTIMAELS
jgi:hypothetical protein